jgi:hypothetical protein
MHDPRDEGPLTDAALDRAIEQALAVDPSPAFVARVRHRVSSEKPLRRGRGWFFAGLAACSTPVLLLAVYLGLPGSSSTPDDAGRQLAADVAAAGSVVVTRVAEDVGHVSSEELAVAVSLDVGSAPPLPRAARRVTLGREVPPMRRTIAVPEIVISEAEVNAVAALTQIRVPAPEQSPVGASRGLDETVGSGTMTVDVAELTIPPLVIEPLQLTARLQGEGE